MSNLQKLKADDKEIYKDTHTETHKRGHENQIHNDRGSRNRNNKDLTTVNLPYE